MKDFQFFKFVHEDGQDHIYRINTIKKLKKTPKGILVKTKKSKNEFLDNYDDVVAVLKEAGYTI